MKLSDYTTEEIAAELKKRKVGIFPLDAYSFIYQPPNTAQNESR